jgi:uncharacterized protein YigA (DUF484 family)
VNAVALAGVITAPLVAGVVAVVLQRQRLRHERSLNDVDRLREVADDGLKLLSRLVNHVFEVVHTHSPDGREDAWRRIEALTSSEFGLQHDRLRLWFGEDHGLSRAWDEVMSALSNVESAMRPTLVGGTGDKREQHNTLYERAVALQRLAETWIDEGREVVRLDDRSV